MTVEMGFARCLLNSKLSRPTVLVVEDNADHLMLSEYILKDLGCHVIGALSGREGLEISIKEAPDLVLLDICLGDISGFEVLAAMNQHPKACDIPVVVTSAVHVLSKANSFINDAKNCRGFLVKPYLVDELASLVDSALLSPADNVSHRMANVLSLYPRYQRTTGYA